MLIRSKKILLMRLKNQNSGSQISSSFTYKQLYGCIYIDATHQKSSQPVYWENSKFLNNRNPNSDFLEYGLVSYLNPHDLSKLFNYSLHHPLYFPLLL
jgi:hypothetical protein